MKKFTYENQGTNTFLVYQVQPEEIIDSMSLGMLTNNKIAGLAPTIYTQLDTAKYIKFNVSAKIPVQQFFVGIVNKKRLLGVLAGVANALLAAEEYMLDPNCIILDLEYIFADVSTCETNLVCLPVVDVSVQPTDVGAFFKNIIFSTQFDQTENCDYVARIINYLNSNPTLSLVDFKDMIEGLQKEGVSVPEIQQPVMGHVVNNSVPMPETQAYPSRMQQEVNVRQPQSQVQVQQVQQMQPIQQPVASKTQNTSYEIPTNSRNKEDVVSQEEQQEEKPMTMMYLLNHYSKKNAAIYKAQKERQKELKSASKVSGKGSDKKQDKKKDKKADKKGKKTQVPQTDFSVPGAPQTDFPVPGQEKILQDAQRQTLQAQQQQSVQRQEIPQQQVQMQSQQNVVSNQTYIPQQQFVQQPANFGDTTVLNGGAGAGNTTVLTGAMLNQQVEQRPYLVRMKNNERILIDKPVFRIGKEKSYVDYFISDNTAVSRSHANIISKNGEYFVIDTNSTNHTYINGQMIQSNVETKIDHNMQLRIANEEFEFRCY